MLPTKLHLFNKCNKNIVRNLKISQTCTQYIANQILKNNYVWNFMESLGLIEKRCVGVLYCHAVFSFPHPCYQIQHVLLKNKPFGFIWIIE